MTSSNESSEKPKREFRKMLLTRNQVEILREAVKPLTPGMLQFCEQLYRVMYSFDVYQDLEYVQFAMNKEHILIINHFVSSADGEEAQDILKQTRATMFELERGIEAIVLASVEEMDKILSAEVPDYPNESQV